MFLAGLDLLGNVVIWVNLRFSCLENEDLINVLCFSAPLFYKAQLFPVMLVFQNLP